MQFAIRIFVLVGVLVCGLPSIGLGEEKNSQPLLDRQALPEALRGVNLRASEIVTAEQAAKIRGNWTMSLYLPYVATQIHGHGPFHLEVWTLSRGSIVGTPVYIRVSIP